MNSREPHFCIHQQIKPESSAHREFCAIGYKRRQQLPQNTHAVRFFYFKNSHFFSELIAFLSEEKFCRPNGQRVCGFRRRNADWAESAAETAREQTKRSAKKLGNRVASSGVLAVCVATEFGSSEYCVCVFPLAVFFGWPRFNGY